MPTASASPRIESLCEGAGRRRRAFPSGFQPSWIPPRSCRSGRRRVPAAARQAPLPSAPPAPGVVPFADEDRPGGRKAAGKGPWRAGRGSWPGARPHGPTPWPDRWPAARAATPGVPCCSICCSRGKTRYHPPWKIACKLGFYITPVLKDWLCGDNPSPVGAGLPLPRASG